MRRFVVALLSGCAGLLLLAYNLSAELIQPTLTMGGFFQLFPDVNFRQLGIQAGYGTAVVASVTAIAFVRRRPALLPLAAAPGLLAVAVVALFWPPLRTYVGHFDDYPQRPFPFPQIDVDRAERDWSVAPTPHQTLADFDHVEGVQPPVLAEAIRSAGITTDPPVIEKEARVIFYESKTAKLDASTREFSFAVLSTEEDARKLFEVYRKTSYCKGEDIFRSTRFHNIVVLAGSCTALPTVSIAAAEDVLRRVGASWVNWRPH